MYRSTRNTLPSIFLLSACVFLFFFYSATVNAQANAAKIQLIPTPAFPAPHTETTISLDDYSLNTVGSSITWFINDVEQKNARNERSLKFTTGNIGEQTAIRVVLSRENSLPLTSTYVINPSIVDIILEAQTHTPSFYVGRALPTRDSMMRVAAVVNDGTKTKDSEYSYTWSLEGKVLFGGQTKGKNVIELEMPHYRGVILTVNVLNATGRSVGEGNIYLQAYEPELHFYEFSALRGLSMRELRSPFNLIGEEATIYGEPYFIDAEMDARAATFNWKLNSAAVLHDLENPNALTVRRVGGSGKSLLDFSVETNTNMPQMVRKGIELIFE